MLFGESIAERCSVSSNYSKLLRPSVAFHHQTSGSALAKSVLVFLSVVLIADISAILPVDFDHVVDSDPAAFRAAPSFAWLQIGICTDNLRICRLKFFV